MGDGSIAPNNKVSAQYGVKFAPDTRFSKELFVTMRKIAEKWVAQWKSSDRKAAMDLVFQTLLEGRLYTMTRLKVNFDYTSIEKEVSSCQNSALVETSRIFRKYLLTAFPKRSSKLNKFYRASYQEDAFKGSEGWFGTNRFGNPQVWRRIQALMESGLYDMWKSLFEFGLIYRNLNFSSENEFQPQSLVSNIATLFILFVGGVSLGVLAFLGEIGVLLVTRCGRCGARRRKKWKTIESIHIHIYICRISKVGNRMLRS